MLDLLQNIGLEDSEAKVYLALLELGPSSVTEVTRKAKITRTLGYHVLENLAIEGLVSKVSKKGNKIAYSALHPRQLEQYVKNKQNYWQQNLKAISTKLPSLISVYKIADKPQVKYQEGFSGIKSIFMETLQSKTEILSILDIEGWDVPELRQWGKDYNKIRSQKKIKERVLLLDTKRAREWMKYYKGSLKYTAYKWVKPEQIPRVLEFGGEINIYEDKVVMALLKKPNRMGIMIQSLALSNLLKALFELAWQVGKPTKVLIKRKKK